LVVMPWGRALKTLRGASFSLLTLELEAEVGKLPGMVSVGRIEGRTARTLAWPGEEPNDLVALPKLMVWSLRKVNSPGTGASTEAALEFFTGGSGRGRRAEISGYVTVPSALSALSAKTPSRDG
jgi:hypothetical protein